VLQDQVNNYLGENFEGFNIAKFDGTSAIVQPADRGGERESPEVLFNTGFL
jgi:hypothetical protein